MRKPKKCQCVMMCRSRNCQKMKPRGERVKGVKCRLTCMFCKAKGE